MKKSALILALALAFGPVNFASGEVQDENFRKIYGVESSDQSMSMEQTVQTMGRYEGTRDDAEGVVSNVDIQTYSYTRPNRFQTHIYVDRKNEKEGHGVPHADLFMMSVDMDMDTYQALFEREEEARLEWVGTVVYEYNAFAKTIDGRRVITIRQNSTVDDETPVVTRKGKAVLVYKDNKLESLHMQKWARRGLLNPIGWVKKYAKVLDVKASNFKRTAMGMALRDEGEVGRAKTAKQVNKALATQRPATYQEIAQENK